MPLLCVYIIFLALAIVFPKSRTLTILISVFLIFMYAFTWHSGDLEQYEWVYREFDSGAFITAYEPGFVALMWAGTGMGLSFTGFRLVLGIFIIGSIYRIIRRQTDHSALVIGLFGLFPFFIFVSVMRSGIATVFVLLALEQLIKQKQNIILYTVYIILGTLFHYSTLLFLPFLLFVGDVKSWKLIWAFVGMCILTILINYTNIIYNIVSRFTQRQKILGWLMRNEATANTKGIIAIVVLLTTTYLLNRNNIRNTSIFNGGGYSVKGIRDRQINISYQMSIYMLFLMPLMVLASPIMRVPYMVYLLFILTTVNVQCERYNITPGTVVITFSGVALLFTILLWKYYADLPYLKNGAHLFSEFIDSTISW